MASQRTGTKGLNMRAVMSQGAPATSGHRREDALDKLSQRTFEWIIWARLVVTALLVAAHVIRSIVHKRLTDSLLETAVFYGEACLFVFLYHSNLVRFIHRFSLVISVKDLLLADVNRQRIIDMIHVKVAKRRTFVKLLCCVGIFFNIAVFGLEARKFSGINVKLTELLTLSLSVATLALYAYLIIFYTRTQSSKFTVDDDKIFEPLETFAEYFTYSGNVLLFPNISFTIQSAY